MTDKECRKLILLMDAKEIANDAAMPVLRSMYPSVSRGEMAKIFTEMIMKGVELADSYKLEEEEK